MTQPPRYVPRSVGHHGAHSGYHHLFSHMQLQPARSPWATRAADLIPRGLAWRLWRLRAQPTSAAGLAAEIGALPWVAFGRERLCHFIYGEDTYLYTPLWQRRGNHSIATFHYPPQRLALRINPGSIACLHAAIIVGENQRAFLEQLLPAERIFYCHHPVDTDFFSPGRQREEAPANDGRKHLLCAGSLFRDYETLLSVHCGVRAAGHDVQTDVIGPGEAQASLLRDVPGIVVHRGISDESMRDLYRRADVGVLPLADATANNSLLEMLACGAPVVVTNVGGVAGYTRGSAARLTPVGDPAAMVREICALLSDAALRHKEGLANREHAVTQLGYSPVATRMREIYATFGSSA